jgi:hypothetical protein
VTGNGQEPIAEITVIFGKPGETPPAAGELPLQ